MQIGKYRVLPGQNKDVNLHIGTLPTGSSVEICARVFRSENAGPTALFLGGMHGDEINGIEIVREAIFSGMFDQLLRGSVIAIPVLNIYGFMNFSRYVPDGKDMNRSFPGSSKGSLASRVAHMMTQKILPLVNFGVDFHTGGDSRFNFPQVRYTIGSQESKALAEIFNPPVILGKSVIGKSLRSRAHAMKIPLIVYESGEALRLDGNGIKTGLDGIKKLLIAKQMVPEDKLVENQSLTFKKSQWIRAQESGVFIWSKGSGRFVERGDVLGHIYESTGLKGTTVNAPRNGYLIAHNNIPVVNIGDALFNLAY